MLFSVLIPLYNAEKYIAECIDSVLAQDFDDYEIVIVDDGSTDESGIIADRYQEMHPQKIRVIHKENTGVLLTRRRLLQEAKGDYILWVDSDDVVKKNWMSDLYKEICKNDPDMIITNYEFLDEPNKVIRSLKLSDGAVFNNKQKHDILTKLILGRNLNELVTKCFKRELVDVDVDYSCYQHVRMGDDLFCLLPVFNAAQRIEYLNRSYYRVRVVSSSVTHTNTYHCYYSYRTIFEREDYYIKKWQFSEQECAQAKDMFAYRVIDCILMLCKSQQHSYDDYLAFINNVVADEKKHPIYSDGLRQLGNKNYQRFYELLMQGKYRKLYMDIVFTTRLSSIKSKIFRR